MIEANKEMIWLQGLLSELEFHQEEYALYSDSPSVINLAKNLAYHARTKHIDVHLHFIINLLEDEVLVLINI